MPDVNYTITIVNETDGEGGGQGVNSTAQVNSISSPQSPEENSNLANLASKVFSVAAVKTALNIGDKMISKEIKRVSLNNGSAAYQARISREYDLIKEDTNTMLGAAGMAMTGNWIGAVVVLASNAYSRYSQRLEEKQENQRYRTLDAITQQYQNKRSGVDNRNVEMLY